MRKRLIGCLTGGVLGFVVATLMNGSLGLSPAVASGACSLAGAAVGYVATTLFDVFLTDVEAPTPKQDF
jgi:hypothetical protein